MKRKLNNIAIESEGGMEKSHPHDDEGKFEVIERKWVRLLGGEVWGRKTSPIVLHFMSAQR
jgi:hypothetical protein